MWVFALYTMIDAFFVANYVGENEFSAINISMPVLTSFFAIGILFSIGTQARAGFYLGRGDDQRAKKIFTTSFISLIIVGLLYSLLIFIFLGTTVHFLGAREFTESAVRTYLLAVLPFGVFFMSTYQLEVLTRLDGFPNIAALSVLTAAVTNLILDYVFIVPLGMGVLGAGLATGIAQVVSTLLLLCHFARKRGRLWLVREINPRELKKVLPLGVGDAISELSIGYTVFLFNTTIYRVLGQEGIIVYTVISYISIFAQVTMTGVAQGLAPLFSYDYGRRETKKIKQSFLGGFAFVLVISLIFNIIARYFSLPLVEIFLKEGSALKLETIKALSKYSYAYVFLGCNILMVTLFASLGRGKIAMMTSLLRTPVLVTAVMFCFEHCLGGDSIWYVLTVSEGVTLAVASVLMLFHVIRPLGREMEARIR